MKRRPSSSGFGDSWNVDNTGQLKQGNDVFCCKEMMCFVVDDCFEFCLVSYPLPCFESVDGIIIISGRSFWVLQVKPMGIALNLHSF